MDFITKSRIVFVALMITLSLVGCGEGEVVDVDGSSERPALLEARCQEACDKVYNECEQIFLHDDDSAMSEDGCVDACVEDDMFHGGAWCVATEAECASQPTDMIDVCIPDEYHAPACEDLGAWDHEVVMMENRVVELVNELRASGTECPGTGTTMPAVGPVEMDIYLQCAARKHAIWMKEEQNLSHTGEGGSSVMDRATAAGYESPRTVGENIAQGYTTAENVVEGWRTSDTGHCENMMEASFEHIGVGMTSNWWAQKFGAQ